MSTNSMIARKTSSGYECIYVHWDGHLDIVGKTLLDTFNTDEKVAELIALGDCSSVANIKSLDHVIAYYRNKGNTWEDVMPNRFATLQEALDYYANSFNYIWRDGTWTVYGSDSEELDWNK